VTEVVAYTFPVGQTGEVRARLRTWDGRRRADLRLFVLNRDGERVPTKTGLSVDLESLPHLLAAVEALIAAAAPEPDTWSPYVCRDCATNTFRDGEFFQLKDDIWGLTGLAPDGGMLCVGCVEARIGRKLAAADFVDGPPNTWGRLYRSDRLQDRMAPA
jgi:hypothetical protein